MKILVLGGTAWLSHSIASAALAAGHDITCRARGTAVPAGAISVQADRDEDTALSVIADIHWDAVIDVSRQPGQVRRAVRDLEIVADRFIFVSTVSVYASHSELGADEGAEVFEPLSVDAMRSPEDYGPAKVACERAVLSGFDPTRSAKRCPSRSTSRQRDTSLATAEQLFSRKVTGSPSRASHSGLAPGRCRCGSLTKTPMK